MSIDTPRPLARDYRDPHTRLGIDLTSQESDGASSFLVHECGFRLYENWNHRDILSPYWRLHHNFAPGNAVRSGGREHPLDPHEILLTPGGVAIDTLGRKTLPHLWIHYIPSQEFLLALRHPMAITIDDSLGSSLACLRSEIEVSLPETEDPEDRNRRLHHLCKAILHLSFARLESGAFQAYPDQLIQLLEFLEENLASKLSTPTLCRISGVSRHRLTELFQHHLGQTPSRYIAELRLRTAMQRLAATDASIEQIAEDLGYPNRYYFSRVFQKRLGCGPASFRRGQR